MTSAGDELRYDHSPGEYHPLSAYGIQLAMIPEGASVLDVGCHAGAFGATVKRQHTATTVFGIDSDAEAIAVASRRLDAAWTEDLTVPGWAARTRRKAGTAFDVVVFGDVLEHLPDPDVVLREVSEASNLEGRIIVSVPNVAHWRIRLALLRGRFEYTDTGILDRTHLRFFTRDSARRLLEDAGYELRIQQASGYRSPALLRAFPTLLGVQHVMLASRR